MNSSAATGPWAIVCDWPSSVSRLGVGGQVERHALPDQHEAAEQRQGQQNPEQRPDQVDPEVAERRRPLAGEAADEGDADRQPGRAGQEVLRHQPDDWVRYAGSSRRRTPARSWWSRS